MTDQIPDDVNRNIDASLGDDAPKPKRKSKKTAAYQVVGDSKIPVSKATGKVWKSRVGQALKHTESIRENWKEAIRYYENDQLTHRNSKDGESGNTKDNQKLNNKITETENVVFANVTTMVPALYARNPEAEFTANRDEQNGIATMLERLVNVIGNRKSSLGINLKPKAKRCVVTTLLTNRSWMKIGWTPKTESSEEAIAELTRLAKELEKTKDAKKIVEIEGKLQALEETIDILQPAGPYARVRSPFDVLVDPNAKEIDLSDAHWLIDRDILPTEFILARYATKDKSGQYKSIYKPTHVLKSTLEGDDAIADQENFAIFKESEKDTAKTFGFNDEEAFNKAKMTEVYFVWDKVTRRVMLFNSKDWSWPIWVWDDPLQLDTFFPYYPLTFFESPSGPLTKGEVSYYLDQQDAINEIADENRRARRWARRNVFFNKNVISQDDVAAVLNGDDGTAKGLNITPETRISDVIGTVPPPSIQFKEIFDKENFYRAIDRISSVSTVMRGEQFKTNTNQQAVQANVGASNMRVDEKSDQIEDWVGAIYWGIAQLCLINMEADTVQILIGEDGAEWENMAPEDIRNMSYRVIGGSTNKPTSQAKKEEALEFGQVLGQFVNAAPGPVLKVMLQVMEKAFDEVTMKEEDWTELQEAIEQASGAEQPPGEGQDGGKNDIATASPEQLKEILAQLPPELKQQVKSAIDSGVSPQKALQSAMQQQPKPEGGQQPSQPQAPQAQPPVAN
jgi:hypothetical protein